MVDPALLSRRAWLQAIATQTSVVGLSALALAGVSHAGEGVAESCGKRVGDQIWVVSTRNLPCSAATQPDLPNYHVQFYSQGTWHPSDAPSFFAQDDAQRTTIYYVHGNRYQQQDAISSGWQLYHSLTPHLSADQRIRLVVWSWPSEAAALRPVRDAREKASRTGVEGLFLARFLATQQATQTASLIGYSFGARVAMGAIHLTGGGPLEGRMLVETPPPDAQYRLAILAGGAEADGLAPGGMFDQTLSRTQELLNLYNPCDLALKHYRAIDKCARPQAIGYTGIVGLGWLDTSKITQRDISAIVGRSHDEQRYFQSPSIMGQTSSTLVK